MHGLSSGPFHGTLHQPPVHLPRLIAHIYPVPVGPAFETDAHPRLGIVYESCSVAAWHFGEGRNHPLRDFADIPVVSDAMPRTLAAAGVPWLLEEILRSNPIAAHYQTDFQRLLVAYFCGRVCKVPRGPASPQVVHTSSPVSAPSEYSFSTTGWPQGRLPLSAHAFRSRSPTSICMPMLLQAYWW